MNQILRNLMRRNQWSVVCIREIPGHKQFTILYAKCQICQKLPHMNTPKNERALYSQLNDHTRAVIAMLTCASEHNFDVVNSKLKNKINAIEDMKTQHWEDVSTKHVIRLKLTCVVMNSLASSPTIFCENAHQHKTRFANFIFAQEQEATQHIHPLAPLRMDIYFGSQFPPTLTLGVGIVDTDLYTTFLESESLSNCPCNFPITFKMIRRNLGRALCPFQPSVDSARLCAVHLSKHHAHSCTPLSISLQEPLI